jgi:hypothetical protein
MAVRPVTNPGVYADLTELRQCWHPVAIIGRNYNLDRPASSGAPGP